ncbi:Hypothetical_protein [Hexamita inflata]|uniref:Hypothetical_protein n=1 Tax=Hexamita inflata TaxID=28002 RepID=A0AA86NQS0_9EUKA|nr:Hypothetical protein HINF_LOCUS12357 [Hexamita inflata]CAI9951555.1 Hypothetical protein HINF_LOCUS39200 [Hexamita inflata]
MKKNTTIEDIRARYQYNRNNFTLIKLANELILNNLHQEAEELISSQLIASDFSLSGYRKLLELYTKHFSTDILDVILKRFPLNDIALEKLVISQPNLAETKYQEYILQFKVSVSKNDFITAEQLFKLIMICWKQMQKLSTKLETQQKQQHETFSSQFVLCESTTQNKIQQFETPQQLLALSIQSQLFIPKIVFAQYKSSFVAIIEQYLTSYFNYIESANTSIDSIVLSNYKSQQTFLFSNQLYSAKQLQQEIDFILNNMSEEQKQRLVTSQILQFSEKLKILSSQTDLQLIENTQSPLYQTIHQQNILRQIKATHSTAYLKQLQYSPIVQDFVLQLLIADPDLYFNLFQFNFNIQKQINVINQIQTKKIRQLIVYSYYYKLKEQIQTLLNQNELKEAVQLIQQILNEPGIERFPKVVKDAQETQNAILKYL